MYKKNHHIHFVGIGGIGMSGIAELLINTGYSVSGSDLKKSEATERLASLGAEIHYGHDRKFIKGADVIVISSAVKPENPEIIHAHEKNIPVIPRAEMLAELMRLKYGIAVAGAHGKTTTTSLVAALLEHGGIDPTVVIGGRLNKTNSNAFLGSGDFLVAEADESDGSFLRLPPTIAVVTNIDCEHMDYYGSMDKIKKTFLEFLNKVPFYGLSIICLDDKNLQSLIPMMEKRVFTYGLAQQADLQAGDISFEGLKSRFNVFFNEKKLGNITLHLPGIHNIYNALAAISVALELNIDFRTIKKALRDFKGIRRRFQVRAEKKNIIWIDDYAHHPTEIKMALKAAKHLDAKRILVLFQPHRYSRTRDLFEEFMTSFYDADLLVITDIYAAGEVPIDKVNSAWLFEGLKKYGHKDVHLAGGSDEAEEYILQQIRSGDLLLTLGAGDIWKSGEKIMEKLS